MSLLTEEQKKRFASIFTEFDKDNDGIITMDECAQALRSFGKRLSETDRQEMEKNGTYDKIDVQCFLALVGKKLQEVDDEPTIKKAFAMLFGENTTSVPVDEFKKIIMEYGERVTEEEANELIADVGAKDGLINIDVFIEKVFGK